jgi:hypothetical protein
MTRNCIAAAFAVLCLFAIIFAGRAYMAKTETTTTCVGAVDTRLLKDAYNAFEDERNRSKFNTWDRSACATNIHGACLEGVTAVYTDDGVTYTVISGKNSEGEILLTFRISGASNEGFNVLNFDGCVDLGWDEQNPDSHYIRSVSKGDYPEDSPFSVTRQAHWQTRYKQAILTLADVLDVR